MISRGGGIVISKAFLVLCLLIALVSCSNHNYSLEDESVNSTVSNQPELTDSPVFEYSNNLDSGKLSDADSSLPELATISLSEDVKIVASSLLLDYEVIDKWVMFPEKEYMTYEEYFSEERVWDNISELSDAFVDGSWISVSSWHECDQRVLIGLNGLIFGHCAVMEQNGILFAVDGKNRTITLLIDTTLQIQALNANDELIFFIAGDVMFRYYVPSGTLDILCETGKYPPQTGNALWVQSNYEVEWESYDQDYIDLMVKYGLGTKEFDAALLAERGF